MKNCWDASQRIAASSDPLFCKFAKQSLENILANIAHSKIQYVITEHPRILRDSIEHSHSRAVDALYYIDNIGQIDLWNEGMMECYLKDTMKTAKEKDIRVRRIFAVGTGSIRTDDEWSKLEAVLNMHRNAGVEVFICRGDGVVPSFFPTRCDVVLIHDERLHIHARKGTTSTVYSTAELITSPELLTQYKGGFKILCGESPTYSPETVDKCKRSALYQRGQAE